MKQLGLFSQFSSINIEELAQDILQGAVTLLPTDTVIGLAVSPTCPNAVERLYQLKDRPRAKSLPIMVANSAQISELGAHISEAALAFLNSAFMPGPLTLVLSLNPSHTPDWLKGRSEVAIRIPKHASLLATLEQTGPLLVTSANISGELPRGTSAKAAEHLTALPDICVNGSARTNLPSTLIDCTSPSVHIIRQGSVSAVEISQIWNTL